MEIMWHFTCTNTTLVADNVMCNGKFLHKQPIFGGFTATGGEYLCNHNFYTFICKYYWTYIDFFSYGLFGVDSWYIVPIRSSQLDKMWKSLRGVNTYARHYKTWTRIDSITDLSGERAIKWQGSHSGALLSKLSFTRMWMDGWMDGSDPKWWSDCRSMINSGAPIKLHRLWH